MKKLIPEKRINVIEKILLLPKNQNRLKLVNSWIRERAYKPGTNEISNRFFKNNVSILSLVGKKYKPQIEIKKYKLNKLLAESQDKINDYL